MVPLLSRLIIMPRSINKGKHLKMELQFALSARPVQIDESGPEKAGSPWVDHNLFSL